MRAIFFDLDNCLAAATEVGESLFQPAFDAIRAANRGTLAAEPLEKALCDCWFHPFTQVATRHGFSERMMAAGWEAFRQLEVRTTMRGYGDLHLLPELGRLRFLVTSGFRRLQESKVRALGIAQCFDAVVIDAIDEESRGKQRVFAELLTRFELRPDEALVVGDGAESELAAGQKLGIRAVQTLRPGVVRSDTVSEHVVDLAALRRLLAAR